MIITSIVNSLGLVASAGIGVSEKLYVFLSIVPMAFMSALSAFVAQNIGAEQPERATRSLFIAQRISLLFGVGMFLLTFFQGGLLGSLFADDPAVIAATAEYLHGSSFEYLMIPLTFCFRVILTAGNTPPLLWHRDWQRHFWFEFRYPIFSVVCRIPECF